MIDIGLMIVSLQRLGSGGNDINITGIYEIGKTIVKIIFWFMTIGMKKNTWKILTVLILFFT